MKQRQESHVEQKKKKSFQIKMQVFFFLIIIGLVLFHPTCHIQPSPLPTPPFSILLSQKLVKPSARAANYVFK